MAINSEHDRISMVSIGAQLKAAREKRSLTLDQVQKQTRIYSAVLGALEDGRCDEMLTAIYVKGFLKKYADYLGLDSRAILKEYDVLHSNPRQPIEPPAQTRNDVTGRPILQPRTSVRLRKSSSSWISGKIKFAVIAILAVSLVIFVGKKIGGQAKHRKAPKAARVAKVKAALPAPRKVQAPKPTEPAPAVKTEVPKNSPLKLEIYVKKPLTVKVKVDGVLQFGRYLSKGTRESLTAKDSINIYATRAENLELTLNGQPLPIAARGLVKDIEITRKGVKVR